MRTPSLPLAAFIALLAAAGSAHAQKSGDDLKYYEATLANGEQAPKPDPWCELATFGTRSVWACPKNHSSSLYGNSGTAGASASGGGGDMGGGDTGGMGGGED